MVTDVFLTSVNGVSETGVMVNVDGTGNRVAGSLFGHKSVLCPGVNKIMPTLEEAIYRARNVAAPKMFSATDTSADARFRRRPLL